MDFKESKYMEITVTPTSGKTVVYHIKQKGTGYELGIIKWYPSWRGYCYFPAGNTVFDTGCLEMITSWVKTANEKHKIRDYNERYGD